MIATEPHFPTPKHHWRWYQFSLGALLTLVTLVAILCSVVKVASPFIPIELAGFAVLAMAIAAIPATIIGRMIGRTFEAIYLGVIWGLWLVIVVDLPEVVSFFSITEPPSPLYATVKVALSSLVGGCFGGFIMWLIKTKVNKTIVR